MALDKISKSLIDGSIQLNENVGFKSLSKQQWDTAEDIFDRFSNESLSKDDAVKELMQKIGVKQHDAEQFLADVNESVMINELSPKTLGNYIGKANHKVGVADFMAGIQFSKGNLKNKKKFIDLSNKRSKGINLATKKLVKKATNESFSNLRKAISEGNLNSMFPDEKLTQPVLEDGQVQNTFARWLRQNNIDEVEYNSYPQSQKKELYKRWLSTLDEDFDIHADDEGNITVNDPEGDENIEVKHGDDEETFEPVNEDIGMDSLVNVVGKNKRGRIKSIGNNFIEVEFGKGERQVFDPNDLEYINEDEINQSPLWKVTLNYGHNDCQGAHVFKVRAQDQQEAIDKVTGVLDQSYRDSAVKNGVSVEPINEEKTEYFSDTLLEGIEGKIGKIVESQLNELSPKTLKNYVDKASLSLVSNSHNRGAVDATRARLSSSNSKTSKFLRGEGDKYDKNINKRLKGINKAVNKLNNESTINEAMNMSDVKDWLHKQSNEVKKGSAVVDRKMDELVNFAARFDFSQMSMQNRKQLANRLEEAENAIHVIYERIDKMRDALGIIGA